MGAGEDQEELLLPLVQAAQDSLAGRLREGVTPEDCGPAFLLSAAMWAMDRLESAVGSDREIASFTAGDLTIRRGGHSGRAGSLSGQADRLLAPWLRDTGFSFRGVRG